MQMYFVRVSITLAVDAIVFIQSIKYTKQIQTLLFPSFGIKDVVRSGGLDGRGEVVNLHHPRQIGCYRIESTGLRLKLALQQSRWE